MNFSSTQLTVRQPPAAAWASTLASILLRFRRLGFLIGPVLFLMFGGPQVAQAQENPSDRLVRVQSQFTSHIRPILEKSCGDCHWGDNDDAGVNLEPFKTMDQLLDSRKLWRKVLTRVTAREMPPEDSQPLTDQEHEAVTKWVDDLLNSVDCTNINAGRVTIRRLNRTEYRNTIRDLLGYDYRPARTFPGDDVGYGFDNIADVLSLPPRLMEKYLDAAEHITSRTIVDPNRGQYSKVIPGKEFRGTKASSKLEDSHMLHSDGNISYSIVPPCAGKYRFDVQVQADQAGDELVKMGISFTGKQLHIIDLPASAQQKMTTVSADIHLESIKQRLLISFLNDYYAPETDKSPALDRNLYVSQVSIHGPLDAEGTFATQWLSDVPDGRQPGQKEAKQVLRAFASRAWRRPITNQELGRLMQLYRKAASGKATFFDGMRTCAQAVLVSPHFLFKVESPIEGGQQANNQSLDDYQLATRLSYFLWSTMPDDQLFELAAENKLNQPKVLIAQVERMLADPKADALVDNFIAQWLQLPKLGKVHPDPDLFPGIDKTMRSDMATETRLLVKDLIKRNASMLELLDVDYSFLNERLADHYGVKGIEGEAFRKVSMKETGRNGIIGHASILTLTSNPTRTSPVKRGKWIMENLLGDEPPPPDPDAIPLENQEELTGTTRERMLQHREDPNCAVCHKVMDELGFALEHFDAVGRWRDEDEGLPVDSRGELPDGTNFDGAIAMQAVIATNMKHKFVRCLTEKMLIYALGRGLEYYDECTTDLVIKQLAENEYRFSDLVTQVALSKPFRERSRSGPRRLKPDSDTPASIEDNADANANVNVRRSERRNNEQ